MATERRSWPDIAIPPGRVLSETLDTLGLSQAELARRSDRPVQAINEIVQGSKEITPETALQFERVLGIPAHVWVRLEADYQFNKARLADRLRLTSEEPIARAYPYADMSKLGWVERTTDPIRRTEELLRFFGVASLRQVSLEAAEFRRSAKVRASREALAAWVRQGEREAQAVSTTPFDAAMLRSSMKELRSLTRQPPERFEPKLKQILAESGVALVLVRHLPRTGAHGATRWLSPDKAIVQMSIRYKWDDIFWFSLFHELGHILLHGKRDVFIERNDGPPDVREKQADKFACDQLINPAAYSSFLAKWRCPDRALVVDFAAEEGISPSIVVGRLHHEGQLPHSHLNDLRSRFEWAEPRGA
jgi:addiction module HigA family antidote